MKFYNFNQVAIEMEISCQLVQPKYRLFSGNAISILKKNQQPGSELEISIIRVLQRKSCLITPGKQILQSGQCSCTCSLYLFCLDIKQMISNASDTVEKMRKDLRKIADGVSTQIHSVVNNYSPQQRYLVVDIQGSC